MSRGALHWPHIARALSTAPTDAMLAELDVALGDVASDLALFVTDYRRRDVVPARDASRASTELAQLALVDGRPSRAEDLLAIPLDHHGDTVGILSVRLVTDEPDVAAELSDGLAPLLALALASRFATDDRLEALRRTRDMALAAEIQWRLLPPTTHTDRDVVLSAALEPAYDTGGDVFDFSRDGSLLRVAILDAMGHGVRASLLSVAAASALRLARRDGAGLTEMARQMAAAVTTSPSETAFVTAVLVDLDLQTGDLSWLTAGHVPPLRRDPGGITPLPHTPNLPLGVALDQGARDLVVHHDRIAAGESLVLYSDGIVDNLRQAGIDSADEREALLRRTLTHHLDVTPRTGVARHIVADLIDRTGSSLRDDATLLVVHPTS